MHNRVKLKPNLKYRARNRLENKNENYAVAKGSRPSQKVS